MFRHWQCTATIIQWYSVVRVVPTLHGCLNVEGKGAEFATNANAIQGDHAEG